MDDALAHSDLWWLCLADAVLILVVMDDALARSNGYPRGIYKAVLILVVMDDALALYPRKWP